ncbi:MAG: RluA family pseudouridine synthase [Ignavibacteriaceae bacterium]
MKKLISEKKYRFDIPPGKKAERLDIYLAGQIENTTRSKVQKAIEAGDVTVNGVIRKANYKVKPGDIVEAVQRISPRPEDTEPEDIPLDILYEDDFLLVINKPAGMVAHPAYANYSGTLVNALLHHTRKLSALNEPGRPGIVHRLDKDTSGLLVVAKDDVTHAALAKQFSEHSVQREYHAVCWGLFKERKGVIETNIARSKTDRKKFTVSKDEGKKAITHYEVITEFDFLTYLKLNLETGRTHQIRVHLSGINHPVFGDPVYGGRSIRYGTDLPKFHSLIQNLLEIITRQALHAKTLGFVHPHSREFMLFDSDLPADMRNLLSKLNTKKRG